MCQYQTHTPAEHCVSLYLMGTNHPKRSPTTNYNSDFKPFSVSHPVILSYTYFHIHKRALERFQLYLLFTKYTLVYWPICCYYCFARRPRDSRHFVNIHKARFYAHFYVRTPPAHKVIIISCCSSLHSEHSNSDFALYETMFPHNMSYVKSRADRHNIHKIFTMGKL